MQLEAIAHSFDESVFQADERVLRHGLSGGNFYVILEGEARVVVGDQMLRTLGRRDFFGENRGPDRRDAERRRGRADDPALPGHPASGPRAPAARAPPDDAGAPADG